MSGHGQRGRFAYPELDRVLHERARLGILSCLISGGTAVTFAELKGLCDLTDGNQSRRVPDGTHLPKELVEFEQKRTSRNNVRTP